MQHTFWISSDGTVLSQRKKSPATLELTVGFPIHESADPAAFRTLLPRLRFSERSRLARVGIELFLTGKITIQNGQIVATAEAFVIDPEFPSARCLPRLLRPGTAVGRLFHFPETAKLNSEEIWRAACENEIELPNTLSIDRFGKVHFTPHRRIYRLPPAVSEKELLEIVAGHRTRASLDSLQTGEDVKDLAMPPGTGLLTSCSMHLPDHYAVLRRDNDNFGLHTGAVLLDPIKTSGSNIMLEIYNASTQIVVNPVVSIDIFRAPRSSGKARRYPQNP